ncbi:MAG: hypothetical protein OXD34_10640 [bacterium]|nr:hypothetical protein [bacterium]
MKEPELPGLGVPAGAGAPRYLRMAAAGVLFATVLLACAGGAEDHAGEERLLEMEARVDSLEDSVESLTDQNARLRSEIASLQRDQIDPTEGRESAEQARGYGVEDVDIEAAEQGLATDSKPSDDANSGATDPDEAASKHEPSTSEKDGWSESKDDRLSPDGSAVEMTVNLVEDSGGEVHYVEHRGRGDRTVLVMPREFVDGETPLIVSLHGFGGNSAYQSMYVPLHERVNTHGFALLLPNGTRDSEGSRFWNPTDRCCDSSKSGEDDVSYLTDLVSEAEKFGDFGPVYFFGYSNGGFMSYHMACKGLPGLRAVASLAGTSYVEDTSCESAAPVSVLHVHGTADDVIQFLGDETGPDPDTGGEAAFYAGALDMVLRWSQRAGCDWPANPRPYAALDLDDYVPGAETQAFRAESGCAEGIGIELWIGLGSGHAPGYGEAFVDALVDWLLSQ